MLRPGSAADFFYELNLIRKLAPPYISIQANSGIQFDPLIRTYALENWLTVKVLNLDSPKRN